MSNMNSSNPVALSNRATPQESNLRACVSCSRAKAKCVPDQQDSGKCQRCQRLKKACEPSAAQVRSQPRKRRPKTTRTHVEKLEEKLDGLVSLIKASQDINSNQPFLGSSMGQMNSTSNASQPLGFITPPTAGGGSPHDEVPQGTELCQNGAALSPSRPPAQCSNFTQTHELSSPISDSSLSNSFMPTFGEANALLHRFRDHINQQFPFIVLRQSLSAEELYLERPFLFISILAISSRDSVQQKGLGKLIMKQLAERMIVNCERSIDLLDGVLTYAGWCYFHIWNVPQLTSLLSSAMTLACDMGLSQPFPKRPLNRSFFEDAIRETCRNGHKLKIVRSLEEQRAYLGCFFLSSVTSMFIRRADSLINYSPYVEDCLKAVDEFEDHPNDKSAVALVKLQVILERIHQCPWHGNIEPHEINAGTMFIVNSLQQELRRFRANLPVDQANNAMVLMHYHVAEISLFGVGLCKYPLLNSTVPNFNRLELLCASLQASKSYFEVFFSIPVVDYIELSLPSWSHLTYCLAVLHILSNYDYPDWNLTYVRETIDFIAVLARLIEKFDIVNSIVGFEKIDMFSPIAKRMNRIKEYFERKMGSHPAVADLRPQPDRMPDFEDAAETDEFSDFFHFLDDTWMRESSMLEPSDYQFAAMES